MRVSRPQLDRVIAENDKRRFAFDETGTRIRASQGHSVAVNLGLPPATPPNVLYHGTGCRRNTYEKYQAMAPPSASSAATASTPAITLAVFHVV